MLPIGSLAPDFELERQNREMVRLSSFRGKQNVVIAFHPLAFTPFCAAQMQSYERDKPRLDALNAHVLGISVDSSASKNGWAQALGGISFDLLADFHPKGAVASAYGVMRDDGIAERAVFVVDKSGKIAWAKQYQIPETPGTDEVLEALARLA